MSDEPRNFHFTDPAELPEQPQESAVGLPSGDSAGPVEPASDEQKPPAGVLPVEPELLSEIRQSLAEEEEQSRRASTTGRLIQRITGSLKRVTGPLGRGNTGPLPSGPEETVPQPPAPLPEIPDDFVSGRLEGTTVSEQPAFRVEMELPDSYQQAYEESYAAVSAEQEESPSEDFHLEEPRLEGDEPISLLESGAIAALGKEEEEERAAESEPDWMAEIRKETAEQGGEPGEKPEEAGSANVPPTANKRRGFTNPLRSFITGVLGGEGRRKPAEEEIPDDLLAGRLNRSMNTGPLPARPLPGISQSADSLPAAAAKSEEEPLTGTGALRSLLGDSLERPELSADQSVEERTKTGSLRKSFFADLDEYELETGQLNPDKLLQPPPAGEPGAEPFPEGRFNVFDQKPPDKPARTPKQTGGIILDEPIEDLTPEEEQLLWKLREQSAPSETVEPPPAEAPLMFTEEEIWGTPGAAEEPRVTGQPWNAPVEIEPDAEPAGQEESQFQPLSDDDYAQAFLTGSLVTKHEEAAPAVNLMQQALEKAQPNEFDAQSLRAIALEGVADEAPSAAGYADQFEDEDTWEKPEPAGPFSFKTWLARRSPTEKFLLVEGAVALLAIIVAVPFFIFVITGGRVPAAAAVQANWVSPRPLPADLPYPVGLTLPGGWSFPLQKSTFTQGEWKPASAEWLEGTELRRVVALPWNPQTEAVIQTFKTGDKIQMDLSNQDKVSYKIKSIDRVPTRDTNIFADLSPSLVIVLYKENSAERWVVQCQPAR